MLHCLGGTHTLNALKLNLDLPLTHAASVHRTVERLIQLKCAECESGPLVFYDPLLQSFSSGHCFKLLKAGVWTLWSLAVNEYVQVIIILNANTHLLITD